MKTSLILFFSLIMLNVTGQVVIGRIIDKKANEPVNYLSIQINDGKVGCFPNSEGYFRIKVNRGDTLRIKGIGFPTYSIQNIPASSDTINLGDLHVVESGFEGYVTYKKKNGGFRCKYVDNSKEIYDKDLSVLCHDGCVKFKWILKDKENAFVDFKEIQFCK